MANKFERGVVFGYFTDKERLVMLERACAALTVLVRAEYPQDRSLADIARTWGDGISAEEIKALVWLEAVDVRDFGATGGLTDDTAAIQAAFDAARETTPTDEEGS